MLEPALKIVIFRVAEHGIPTFSFADSLHLDEVQGIARVTVALALDKECAVFDAFVLRPIASIMSLVAFQVEIDKILELLLAASFSTEDTVDIRGAAAIIEDDRNF